MTTKLQTAFVPAAGFGTRMRHLTAARPKPLVRVAGQTLIDRVLDRLVAAGIDTVVVNLHYKADCLETALARRAAPALRLSDERARLLDTGGGVKKALPLLGPAPFLIHNSDSLWLEHDAGHALAALEEAWDNATMDCLMLLALRETSVGFCGPGDFVRETDGRLVRRGERPTMPFVFTGVSIAHPRLFDATPDGPFSLNLVWDRAIAAERLYGIVLDGVWMHVGTPEAVADAARLLAAPPSSCRTEPSE